ncbi:hypothetical protein LOK49_LG01G01547 [Camellia lanceoleosa]|uniref:Uncharacterized protein n=1 Tax=Camellia lanceoleosa TaxID=1840588 RepID=A0ACC0IZN1_9ERIC|nr:hypothetical protein LOK49_LG01G01547 [Camellia lanceoleosa]
MEKSPLLKISEQDLHQWGLLQQVVHHLFLRVLLQLSTQASSTSSAILRGVKCCLAANYCLHNYGEFSKALNQERQRLENIIHCRERRLALIETLLELPIKPTWGSYLCSGKLPWLLNFVFNCHETLFHQLLPIFNSGKSLLLSLTPLWIS